MSCTQIASIAYGDFSRRWFDRAGEHRLPISLSLEVTGACNVACLHCYMPGINRHDEISTDEIRRILDEAADAGVLWLLLTGGEPFVRKDFVEIYKYSKKKGFIINLFSNGTLIDERIADMLAEWPPFVVEITVHSMNEEIFDKITRVKGSFARCMEGIWLLHERGINLRIKTVAMKQNKGELNDIERFAAEIGAEHRFDPHIQPKINGDDAPLRFRLSPEEIVELDSEHTERLRDWKEIFENKVACATDHIFSCGAGVRSCYVNAQGRLSACLMTNYLSYDLKNGSFREAWSEFLPSVINRRPKTEYKCHSCELIVLCGRCPAWAYLEAGDEEAPVDHLCRIGSLRERAIAGYQGQIG